MKTFITLDYELFFGEESGTVENCLIRPTEKLLCILKHYSIKATFFVDVGYLIRCEELGVDMISHGKVLSQLRTIQEEGHDIQLHIHPHWERSYYIEGKWQCDLSYFKLHDFSIDEASHIIKKYQKYLSNLTNKTAIAFRAGGWCIQPFSYISEALWSAGIRVDSTIYHNGINISDIKGFDFTSSPVKDYWYFDDDPMTENEEGQFVELPISSVSLSPLFYWKFACAKKISNSRHKSFGDGKAAPMTKTQLIRFLTKTTQSVASIDGYKAGLLPYYRSSNAQLMGEGANLVLIGHPKSFSNYSLRRLDSYLNMYTHKDSFYTISDWFYEK